MTMKFHIGKRNNRVFDMFYLRNEEPFFENQEVIRNGSGDLIL